MNPFLQSNRQLTERRTLKDTLTRPLHDLRISVIDRCNYRCSYCMPQEETSAHQFLQEKQWLTFDEITRLTKILVHCGVVKVRLTGGEPLLRPDLVELVEQLIRIPKIEDLALTTNGSLLKEYVKPLKKAGLNRLTISLDTLNSNLFKTMSGNRGSLSDVLESIEAAEAVGFDSIKINVVIQKGVNDKCILDIVDHFKKSNHVVRFIEYMDVGNCNHWKPEYVMPSRDILELINKYYALKPVEAHYFGEVAQRYKFKEGGGEVGFISSVSQPFCRSCTRARLSTDGKIYTCLFAENGHDLRSLIYAGASDEDLFSFITNVWTTREDRYSEQRPQILSSHKHPHKVEMFQIGG